LKNKDSLKPEEASAEEKPEEEAAQTESQTAGQQPEPSAEKADNDTPKAESQPEAAEPPKDDWQGKAAEAGKRCAELVDRLQRTMAEFDNFRKRTVKEKASMYNDGVRDTLEKLLPVVDNFERALNSTEDHDNALYKGLEMTFRQLSDVFKKLGVEPLPSVGETFDPNVHHAVAHIEDENLDDNVIVEELQKGYKYKDKVIRPSMVKVAN
jgi:molecular chaperone GrpE